MSEDTGSAAPEPGTGQVESGDNATGTDAEDPEAAKLLGGMLSNDPEALAAELAKWKDEARKWEGRSKKNSDAAARLKEIEDANKTELQKAVEAQQEAERQRDNAIATHSRVMAAAAHNLPVELIDYLPSGTEDEINAAAEAVARAIDSAAEERAQAIIAGQAAGRNGQLLGARPVESMRPGSQPAAGETPNDPNAWFRQLFENR